MFVTPPGSYQLSPVELTTPAGYLSCLLRCHRQPLPWVLANDRPAVANIVRNDDHPGNMLSVHQLKVSAAAICDHRQQTALQSRQVTLSR